MELIDLDLIVSVMFLKISTFIYIHIFGQSSVAPPLHTEVIRSVSDDFGINQSVKTEFVFK